MDRMPQRRTVDFITARPIAHRGLHDISQGIVENTASAFAGAIARGYAIECDLQLTGDGEAVVFHDERLERLTQGRGMVKDLTAAEMKRLDHPALEGSRADAGRTSRAGEGQGAAHHRAQVPLGRG
jgi:glycerophosphoryl diester phosphodiesterase